MKRENFYRRNPSDALAGMVGMSLEERGVYNTLIDLLYSTWRPVEDSRPFIANWCGCAVQKLNPILDRLIARRKLIRFEDDGAFYITNGRFEEERAEVRGPAKSRSGRGEGREKSAGVAEKSAGVAENAGVLGDGGKENQSLAPLEENRREEKRDSFVAGQADDGPGKVVNLFGEQEAEPAETEAPKVKVYPAEFEAAWKAYPHVKGRSSKPDSLARWEKLDRATKAALPAAVARYAAEGREPKMDCGAQGMERWLKAAKFADWMTGADAPAPGATARRWNGPPEIRADLADRCGEDFARKWLDVCTWQDRPRRVIITPTHICAQTLKREPGAWAILTGHGAEVIQRRAQA